MDRAQQPGDMDVSPGPSVASYVILSFFTSEILFSIYKMRLIISTCTVVTRIKCETVFKLRGAIRIQMLVIIAEANQKRVIDLSIVPS